jgi:hypothetical protein
MKNNLEIINITLEMMKANIKMLYKMLLMSLLMQTVLSGNILLAASPAAGSITVKKCADFAVTGDGSAANWTSTDWITVAQQGKGPAIYSTKVKALYSETGIYFLFSCEDKKLTVTLEGDFLDLFNEDVVEVFLWPDETFPVYFEYEVSPLNYELPIIIPNYNGSFYGWRPWHYEGERRTRHETSVTGGKKGSGADVTGWMAEFFIPYKLLTPLNKVPPVSGTKWRANMYRIDYDKGTALFAWQKIDRSFHEYDHFGTLIFE